MFFFWNNSKSLRQVQIRPLYVSGEVNKWNLSKLKNVSHFKGKEEFKTRKQFKPILGYSKLKKNTYTTVDDYYLTASNADTFVWPFFFVLAKTFLLTQRYIFNKIFIKKRLKIKFFFLKTKFILKLSIKSKLVIFRMWWKIHILMI